MKYWLVFIMFVRACLIRDIKSINASMYNSGDTSYRQNASQFFRVKYSVSKQYYTCTFTEGGTLEAP